MIDGPNINHVDSNHGQQTRQTQLSGEASEKLYDSITGMGIDKLLNVIDCGNEMRTYLLSAKDNHKILNEWIDQFDVKFTNLSDKIRQNVVELIEIDLVYSLVKTALKAKKIINWYKKEWGTELIDVQTMILVLKDIEIIIGNKVFKSYAENEREELFRIKSDIRNSVYEIIKYCLACKKYSVNEVVYILISDKSFETNITEFFNNWVSSFHHQFIMTISTTDFDSLKVFLNDSLKSFHLIYDLDISILNTNSDYFSNNLLYKSYSHQFWSLITTNIKNRCSEFFKTQTNCDYVFERNYLQFYFCFNIIDAHFNDRKYQFTKSASVKQVISDNFELKFLNKLSKIFNNFLIKVFNTNVSQSAIYDELNDLLNSFYKQIDFASTFDREITSNLHERLFQFVEVLCSRILKMNSSEITPKQNVFYFLMIKIIDEFITTNFGPDSLIKKLVKDKNIMKNIVTDCLKYLRDALCESLNLIYDAPIKYVTSDYLQLSRFKYQDVYVSNIVIEIKNALQNWSNIFQDLKTKSYNHQTDILNHVIEKLSTLLIHSNLIIKFSTQKHKDDVIDDNFGFIKVFTAYDLNPSLILTHRVFGELLKSNVRHLDVGLIKKLLVNKIDPFLLGYFIINNREENELFTSKFTNSYEFYHWLSHNTSQDKRKILFNELLSEKKEDYPDIEEYLRGVLSDIIISD